MSNGSCVNWRPGTGIDDRAGFSHLSAVIPVHL